MRSMRYQPIFHTIYFTLHRARILNNVVLIAIIEMVEVPKYWKFGKHSVERVWYVINNLLHLVTVKYGVISHILCISTRLQLVTMLTLLVSYLVIFHADKSYIYNYIQLNKCEKLKM